MALARGRRAARGRDGCGQQSGGGEVGVASGVRPVRAIRRGRGRRSRPVRLRSARLRSVRLRPLQLRFACGDRRRRRSVTMRSLPRSASPRATETCRPWAVRRRHSSSPSTCGISKRARDGRACPVPTAIRMVRCRSGSPRRRGAPERSSASRCARGGSSASTAPTGCSPRISDARSSLATRNASFRDAMSRQPGARSITSPSMPAADRRPPTTECRCAGGITDRLTAPGGRSA